MSQILQNVPPLIEIRKANASDLHWEVHHWFPSIYAWAVVYSPRVQRLVLIWWEKWLRTSWMKRGAGTAGSKVELLETGEPGGAETSSFEQKYITLCASKCFLIDVPFLSPENLE